MRKRYLIIALLFMFMFHMNVEAFEYSDCEVLISFKQSSSLDEDSYICKGEEFGKSTDKIYYDGSKNVVKLNGFDAYYLTFYADMDVDVTNDNNISLLHLNNSKLNVVGSGSLKFKEGSYVKKVISGEPIYRFVYNDKTLINEEDKIYEGTIEEFEQNYSSIALKNGLSNTYNLEDYTLVQVLDFTNMTSVVVTESWLEKHIDTKLNKTVLDGYGIIKFIEEKKEEVKEEKTQQFNDNKEDEKDKTLESEKVIFVSDKKVNKEYKLNVDDLNSTKVADDVSSQLKDTSLISFYDVNVYKGKKKVPMKNGKYTLKIKIDDELNQNYENYQIIYVNDDGEIVEYLDGVIEDGYIVFKTSHLSQYGVIAKEKVVEEIMIQPQDNASHIDLLHIVKISIIVLLIVAYLIIISVLLAKSKLIKFKRFKKMKRRTN